MNAWIDCLSHLHGEVGMCTVTLLPADPTLAIVVPHLYEFKTRVPEVCDAPIECRAFVNQRYAEAGDANRIAFASRAGQSQCERAPPACAGHNCMSWVDHTTNKRKRLRALPSADETRED